MKNAQDSRDSDSSQIESLNIGSVNLSRVIESQEIAKAGNPLMSEHRSRYSMNYQSYEATRIQPGEQTRRMLDYMFPGYQKRDPRNWYEMQTQTDLGWFEIPSLIGTELIEGEPIEAYEDKIKSFDDGLGDDFSDYEGPTEKKAAVRKGHRSSVMSRVWEGPPIKMSGKSSQEGFHLEVDDFYHEPQTILVPRDVIEHQELKMDIVPDDQGVPKVIIYLGNKEPSDEVVKEPGSTVILYDGKEEFDQASSDSGEEEEEEKEEEKIEPIPEDKSITISTSELEEISDPEEPTAARDSMEVVPPTVIRVDLESDSDLKRSDKTEDGSSDLVLGKGLNSILLEPIYKTGSHDDVFEDVIEVRTEISIPKVQTPPREPSPPPKEPTPPPKEPTPPPREPTPTPPREPSPTPPREPTPTPPKEPSPSPKELTPPSLVLSPSPSPASSVASSIDRTPEPPSPVPPVHVPPTPATASIPSQTNSHIGSPPDRLFGPLENYPNDLEEDSDRVVHSPPKQQLPSPSKDDSDDHPLKVTDDYPPQYSPPPREASEVSNWLEDNILSEARNLAKKSPKDASPRKPSVSEPQLLPPTQGLEPMEGKTKIKAARFRDDETLPHPRALEERFSIYYPPPKPKKKKVPKEEVETSVPERDDNLEEENAVDEWVDEEILAPAAVANWIDKEIISKSKEAPPKTAPLPVSKAIPQTVASSGSIDSNEERVDAWIDDEILKPAQVDNWVTNKIMKPAEKQFASKPVPSLPPERPSPPIPLPLLTPSPQSISPTPSRTSYASSPSISEPKLIPGLIISTPPSPIVAPQPAIMPKERGESSGSIDVDEKDVDSWILNELLEPAQADAWIEKKIVQPAEVQNWVERQIMKPASASSHQGGKMMKPPAEESSVDDIVKPTEAKSPPIVESREKTVPKSVSPIKQPSSLQLRPPSSELHPKYAFRFPESDDNIPVEVKPPPITELPLTPKYSPEKPPSPVKDERVKEAIKPEKYLSDMDMGGPFQPHPDHPDEYPRKMTEERQLPDMKALLVPARQSETKPIKVMPGTSLEEKPETSFMKLQKPSTVEKTPTVTSLGRKPSLKQKSDSESLSKIKLTDVEPEKKDRPSVMAKKAIEADNYLLRDEDEDYVKPKMSPPTTDERRRSSSSKKLASLSNLFKRKRSSQDSQKMAPTIKDDEKGKIKQKQLSPIEEEEDIIPPKVTTFLPSTSGKELVGVEPAIQPQGKTTYETAKFPKKPIVVAPEEIFHTFPEFPDREEVTKNQKKPTKFEVKTRPDPPKKGFPEFPDYKQLTETQPTDSSPSKEKPLDPKSLSQVRSKSEETPKFKERSKDKLDEIKSISVAIGEPSSDQLRKEPSIPRVASQKVLVRGSPSSNVSEPTKTQEERCWSTEPTPPGDGVPKFSDYQEANNMLPKPQSDTQSRAHQLPASFSDSSPQSQPMRVAQEPTSLQQPQPSGAQVPYVPHSIQMPSNMPLNVAQQPPFTPGIKSEERPDELLQTSRPQPQPYTSSQRAYTKPYEEKPSSTPSGYTKLYGPSKEAYSQTQLKQAPSFKKHDYSQPDKPVQRMTVPLQQQMPSSGERGDLQSQPEHYSQSPSQNQKNMMLTDGSIPPSQRNIPPYGGMVGGPPEGRRLDRPSQPPVASEGYISVKQRGPQQSPGTPYGQVYQQGPGPQNPSGYSPLGPQGPYGTGPQDQLAHPSGHSPLGPQGPYGTGPQNQQAHPSGYSPLGPQGPYGTGPTNQRTHPSAYSPLGTQSPYSKPYQYGTHQPAAPPYGNYGPFQQTTPYGKPYGAPSPSVQPQLPYGVPTTSPYTPRSDQQRTAPDFTPYGSLQTPGTKPKTQKSAGIQKHTYSHPEKPLPLAQTRPRGFEDDNVSPYSSPEKETSKAGPAAGQDNKPISERQTSPIEPGGGVPRFPDFETASEPTKPPTMTGDFRKTPHKPKTVTAADKRAEFDMEIQPIMQQIQDLKRQMYELTPQKGPPLRTGPEHGRPLPTSLQLYNELEKRTLAATKPDREEARAERRKQQYEANARRRIEREIERSKQTK